MIFFVELKKLVINETFSSLKKKKSFGTMSQVFGFGSKMPREEFFKDELN